MIFIVLFTHMHAAQAKPSIVLDWITLFFISVYVLQQAYHADKTMTIANVEAVPLYLHCLRKAAPDLQLRGLVVWKKLLQGNMANLSASDRYWETLPLSCQYYFVCTHGCLFLNIHAAASASADVAAAAAKPGAAA